MAPNPRGDRQTRVVAPHHDDAFCAEAGGGEDAAQAHRTVTDDHDGRAGVDAGTHGRVVTGARHVGERCQCGRQTGVREIDDLGELDERGIRKGRADRFPLAAVVDRPPVAALHARGVQPDAAVLADAV